MKKQLFAIVLLVSVALNAAPRKRIKIDNPKVADMYGRIAESLWVVASLDRTLGLEFHTNDYSPESVMKFADGNPFEFLKKFERDRISNPDYGAAYRSKELSIHVLTLRSFFDFYTKANGANNQQRRVNTSTIIAGKLHAINKELGKLR